MITRRCLPLIWGVTLAATRITGAQCPGPCLVALRALKLDSLPGPVQTYYSSGFQTRARVDQALLREEERFFADSLQLGTGIRLALLNQADWKRVNAYPYGLPNVDTDDLAWHQAPRQVVQRVPRQLFRLCVPSDYASTAGAPGRSDDRGKVRAATAHAHITRGFRAALRPSGPRELQLVSSALPAASRRGES